MLTKSRRQEDPLGYYEPNEMQVRSAMKPHEIKYKKPISRWWTIPALLAWVILAWFLFKIFY